jgi:two-component system LytT family response regulator
MNPDILIVDDEEIARKGLRKIVAALSPVSKIEERSDGKLALEYILSSRPDIVFLDIEMPVMNGLEVLQHLSGQMPFIIFVTAFSQHAVKAFELQALDYVLKPLEEERIKESLKRAIQAIRTKSTASYLERVNELLETIPADLKQPPKFKTRKHFFIRSNERIIKVEVSDLKWISSAGNYVEFHCSSGEFLYRETMKNIMDYLPEDDFLRISRSVIVNVKLIRELRSTGTGKYKVILQDSTILESGPSYQKDLDSFLDN